MIPKEFEIEFKSNEAFFHKEKSGLKNNTVRKFDPLDERFQKMFMWVIDNDIKGKYIRMRRSTIPESFVREIKDISCYEDLFIITWIHNKD